MDAIEAIRKRRSVRRFRPGEISRERIEEIIDAARFAPSCENAQPWEFVVVANQNTREKIASVAEEGAFISNAPVVIVVLCRETGFSLEAGCAAVENLLIAATAKGLASCWVAGAHKKYAPDVKKLVKARGNQHLIALIPLGYPEKEPMTMPAKRLVQDVIHWEKYGG